MVLYFDIFRHPLRRDELSALCGDPTEAAVAQAVRSGAIEVEGVWAFRAGRGGDRARRQERSVEAERQWGRARRAASVLAATPFVRGVLVTGGLSKLSAEPGGDVDFMLLVEPGRVWTVKAGLHAARRVLPGPLRESLCTNYLLATDSLALPQRSMFHAVELATAIPMFGPVACSALLRENPWLASRVPGQAFALARAEAAPRASAAALRSSVEALVPAAVERLGAEAIDRLWERRYAWLPEAERTRRFQRGTGVATNHLHDYSGWVNAEYARRCAAVGLEE